MSVVDSYKDGQGDLYVEGCDDCILMLRAGYGKAGCYSHKAQRKIEDQEEEIKFLKDQIAELQAHIQRM